MYYALAPSPIPCSRGLADGLYQAPLRAARPLLSTARAPLPPGPLQAAPAPHLVDYRLYYTCVRTHVYLFDQS